MHVLWYDLSRVQELKCWIELLLESVNEVAEDAIREHLILKTWSTGQELNNRR